MPVVTPVPTAVHHAPFPHRFRRSSTSLCDATAARAHGDRVIVTGWLRRRSLLMQGWRLVGGVRVVLGVRVLLCVRVLLKSGEVLRDEPEAVL